MDFTFEGNTSLDSLSAVPNNFHVFYKETDGKFALDNENPAVQAAVASITGFQKTVKASRAETDAAKAKRVDLAPLADYGTTPDEIKTAIDTKLTEAAEAAKAAGGTKLAEQVEKIKEDLAKGHSKELEARDARITGLTGQLYGLLVTSALNSGITEASGNPALLTPMLEKQLKVSEEDGKFVVSVVDGAGDVRYSGATGAPMSVAELVAEVKADEKFGMAFESENKDGTRTKPNNQNRNQNRRKTADDMTSTEKISAGLGKGQHVGAGAGNS